MELDGVARSLGNRRALPPFRRTADTCVGLPRFRRRNGEPVIWLVTSTRPVRNASSTGWVRTAVAERELVRGVARSKSEQLMAQQIPSSGTRPSSPRKAAISPAAAPGLPGHSRGARRRSPAAPLGSTEMGIHRHCGTAPPGGGGSSAAPVVDDRDVRPADVEYSYGTRRHARSERTAAHRLLLARVSARPTPPVTATRRMAPVVGRAASQRRAEADERPCASLRACRPRCRTSTPTSAGRTSRSSTTGASARSSAAWRRRCRSDGVSPFR